MGTGRNFHRGGGASPKKPHIEKKGAKGPHTVKKAAPAAPMCIATTNIYYIDACFVDILKHTYYFVIVFIWIKYFNCQFKFLKNHLNKNIIMKVHYKAKIQCTKTQTHRNIEDNFNLCIL